MRLTDLAIRNLTFTGKSRKIFDDSLPNFGVRVYQSGISFIVMLGTERKMKTLGRYPEMSLKDARTSAVTILNGTNPQKSTYDAHEAVLGFLAHCRLHNSPRTVRDYTRLLNKHMPQENLTALTRTGLIRHLEKLSHVPGEQSHATTAIQVFLNWCVGRGYIENNPIHGVRKLGKIEQRQRILTDDELRIVFNRARDFGYPFGTIIHLCITTGQRRGEIRALLPSFIKNDTITLPRDITKNRREHTFPYGPLTQNILSTLPETGFGIFNGWSKCKRKFDEPLSIDHYTIHDLRRTFASKHAELGTPIHIIEKHLNHVSGSHAGVAGIYNRYHYLDEMREACQRYEDFLSSLTT